MLNRVALVGRLTREPELSSTGNGTAVTSFTLAVDRNFSTRDGQEADFINCVVWRKPAENVAQYCSKGSLVSVDGRIQTRNYDNNQGQKVYVTEVIADSVQFISTRNNNTATAAQAHVNNYVPNEPIQQFEDEGLVMEEDDIQF